MTGRLAVAFACSGKSNRDEGSSNVPRLQQTLFVSCLSCPLFSRPGKSASGQPSLARVPTRLLFQISSVRTEANLCRRIWIGFVVSCCCAPPRRFGRLSCVVRRTLNKQCGTIFNLDLVASTIRTGFLAWRLPLWTPETSRWRTSMATEGHAGFCSASDARPFSVGERDVSPGVPIRTISVCL
ncbi:hypothetical protein EDB92DRAFT_1552720 [Lactarius akahatsu]|uniref:Uncharacterized protein n=1 Tax=Lactarius akahatsu TaxID=416441 RepID=A0AAD4Q4K7_9AGAM|nr:hypothetical protein EDB92DRAFT_1552720 [Lactarius akahatsu]